MSYVLLLLLVLFRNAGVDQLDREFKSLIQSILVEDVSGSPSTQGFVDAVKNLEQLIGTCQRQEEPQTVEMLQMDIERKRVLLKSETEKMERWKSELRQAVNNASQQLDGAL